ncbi:T-cell surface glycoprotein CD8 beta chain isoform X2 [Lemur catta]|uniref:T-cell surface glycoprotein CD8 beta chain isoform X2 n=1 Tax=Lemur catta TaxID=9447 RepID=UPI001E26ACAF|nr:T-cell surface glycoprotein CD8 beta chain isoform X2 [Lemur catta]
METVSHLPTSLIIFDLQNNCLHAEVSVGWGEYIPLNRRGQHSLALKGAGSSVRQTWFETCLLLTNCVTVGFTNERRIQFWCPATKRHWSVTSKIWKNERREISPAAEAACFSLLQVLPVGRVPGSNLLVDHPESSEKASEPPGHFAEPAGRPNGKCCPGYHFWLLYSPWAGLASSVSLQVASP